MRVLHLLKTGVGARWALLQVQELVRLGLEVHVALPSGPMVERFAAAGTTVHVFQSDIAAYQPWAWPRLMSSVRNLVARVAPDLIHSHFVGTTATMRIALADIDLPRVFQVPGPLHLEHPLYARAELSLATPQDWWIAACRWTRSAYLARGISERRVFLSYYTTDLARFTPGEDDGRLRQALGLGAQTKLVGMVAFFYPPKRYLGQRRGLKGHEDFIDAIAWCRSRGRDVVGVVAGGAWGGADWYEQRVRAYAQVRCPGGIHFLGHRDDVPALYTTLTLAVHPSLSENVGGAIESSLMAVPTIATAIGGFPDLIRPGKTGWLVPPAAPVRLGQTILRALDDPLTAKRLAANARAQALEQFSPTRLGQEIHDIYRQILGRSAP